MAPRGDTHADLKMMCTQVVDLGGETTKDIFEFPGDHRFQFRGPGGGEFAIWSDNENA
jgi:predicted enzyme related to lactoylglutathione lyase